MTAQRIEWAVASRPLESGESGDAFFVRPLANGTFLGVVDGLGHGSAAAEASGRAVELLANAPAEYPLDALRLCHEGLRTTRGVVLALAWIDDTLETLTWLAVGNVQGVLLRNGSPGDAGIGRLGGPGAAPQEALLGRGGVVGRQLPPPRASTVPIVPGDVVILATDGIRPDFARSVAASGPAQRVADSVLAEHRTGADDALVLVVRYRGATP